MSVFFSTASLPAFSARCSSSDSCTGVHRRMPPLRASLPLSSLYNGECDLVTGLTLRTRDSRHLRAVGDVKSDGNSGTSRVKPRGVDILAYYFLDD